MRNGRGRRANSKDVAVTQTRLLGGRLATAWRADSSFVTGHGPGDLKGDAPSLQFVAAVRSQREGPRSNRNVLYIPVRLPIAGVAMSDCAQE